MIFYCARTTGGAARGVSVIQALGEGMLVTAYRKIAMHEQIDWMRQVPLARPGDVFIYDKVQPCRPGRRVIVGAGGDEDADAVIDWAIVPRAPTDNELFEADAWWKRDAAPARDDHGRLRYVEARSGPDRRVLAVRGGGHNKVRQWEVAEYVDGAHFVAYGRYFYWPAFALMATADEVLGGEQAVAEWTAVRGEGDPDGARRAAAEIRRIAGRG